MSVKIRLRRMGKKKQPHYRIVAIDSRAPRDGRFVENLGYYHPVSDPARLSVDLSRVEYWVGQGAIVSPTVRSLVSRARAGGDDKVALVGADSGTDAEPEARAAPGNGAAAGDDAAADPPEAAAGDDAAAPPPEAAAEDDAVADAPEPTAEGADAAESSSAPEPGDSGDAEPESGAA